MINQGFFCNHLEKVTVNNLFSEAILLPVSVNQIKKFQKNPAEPITSPSTASSRRVQPPHLGGGRSSPRALGLDTPRHGPRLGSGLPRRHIPPCAPPSKGRAAHAASLHRRRVAPPLEWPARVGKEAGHGQAQGEERRERVSGNPKCLLYMCG